MNPAAKTLQDIADAQLHLFREHKPKIDINISYIF